MPTHLAATRDADSAARGTTVSRAQRLLASPYLWLALALFATLIHAAVRIAITPWYFFWDDTQLGAYGQWFELGRRLLDGTWTILDPGAWQGGNLLAEGQWGLWSPLAWLVALASHLVPSAAVFATIVKIAFLLLLCVATFLLARDYGASPGWAAVAAFGATAGGQTMYLDSPSWVTGLQSVALFTLTWVGLRRYAIHRRSPLLFLAAAYLLITTGYVFGVIELVVLFVFVLIECWRHGRWRGQLRPLMAGLFAGLLTVFVYLPGILTSPVTVRSDQGIANDMFLNMDISDLATMATSTAVSTVRGYWGDVAPVPLQYVTWLLPLLVVVGVGILRLRRELLGLYGVLLVTIALVIGPSVLGPLRYPARMMPYVVVPAVVVIAVLASRSWPRTISRAQWMGVGVVSVAGAGIAWAAVPSNWDRLIPALVIQVLGFGVIAWLASAKKRDLRTAAIPGVALAVSLIVLVPQAQQFPTSALGTFNVPSSVEDMERVGDALPDGVMTIGDVYSLRDTSDAYSESLIANLWYLADRDVVGVYTVLPFREFAADLCIDIRGATCSDALETLFRTTSSQPVPVADDLRLNAVIVIPGPGLEKAPEAPDGWTVVRREFTWLLTRDEPVSPAGGVARTAEGVEVSDVVTTDTQISFVVGSAPQADASVVLSRLAWPGYDAEGAELVDPERGFLLTVDVSGVAPGTVVTVTFRPPGWALEVSAVIVALVLAVAMIFFPLARSRWKRRLRPGTVGTQDTDAAR